MMTNFAFIALLGTLLAALAANAADVLVIEGTLFSDTTCTNKLYSYPEYVAGVCKTLPDGTSIMASCEDGKPVTMSYDSANCSATATATNELDKCVAKPDAGSFSVTYSCKLYSDQYIINMDAGCPARSSFFIMMAADRCRPNAAWTYGYKLVVKDSETTNFAYYHDDLTCSGTPFMEHDLAINACASNFTVSPVVDGVTLKNTPRDYTPEPYPGGNPDQSAASGLTGSINLAVALIGVSMAVFAPLL